jgi:DNA-binding transcriptional MerR regulator
MVLPIIIGAASLIAGAVGVKKSRDAKKLYEEAKEIGESAERRHRRAVRALEEKREQAHKRLEALGQRKKDVFETTARVVVDLVQNARATAQLHEIELTEISQEDVVAFERELTEMSALDVSAGVGQSVVLATLGAGSLGVVGGGFLIGGLVAGPALAITGFSHASKAEEALTQAEEYAAEVKRKIAELEPLHVMLDGIIANIKECETALDRLMHAFQTAETQYHVTLKKGQTWWAGSLKKFSAKRRQEEAVALEAGLQRLIAIFKAIKEVVQTPLLDEEQAPQAGLSEQLSHILEVANIPQLPAPQGESA